MPSIRNLFFPRRRRYSDLSVSIREHIEERIDELVEEGIPRDEAVQRARREFGTVALIEERSREVWPASRRMTSKRLWSIACLNGCKRLPSSSRRFATKQR